MMIFFENKFLKMARFLVVFLLLSLSACQHSPVKKNIEKSNFHSIPKHWQMQAKVGVKYQNEYSNFSLNWQAFEQGDLKLLLSAPLFFDPIAIEKSKQGVFINDQRLETSLQNWMLARYGWFLPITRIGHWLFLGADDNPDWQVRYLSYQQIGLMQLPKQIELASHKQAIIIRIMIKDVVVEDSLDELIF